MKKIIAVVTLVTLASVVAGCDRPASEPEAAASEPEAATAAVVEAEVSIYAAAVASETRPEADRESDAGRKPEAVLEFFGIQPGDVVLEMWAGGGYYTELLAHVVGESGKVIAHANTPILSFAGLAEPWVLSIIRPLAGRPQRRAAHCIASIRRS